MKYLFSIVSIGFLLSLSCTPDSSLDDIIKKIEPPENIEETLFDKDFQINDLTYFEQKNAKVACYKNKALVVWESMDNGRNTEIRGRFIDLKTGKPTGEDLLISESGYAGESKPQISVGESGRGFIVWNLENHNYQDTIKGREFDLCTGKLLGDECLTVNTIKGYQSEVGFTDSAQYEPTVAITGDKAIITWIWCFTRVTENQHHISGYSIQGRIYSLTQHQFLNDQSFGLGIHNDESAYNPVRLQMAAEKNRAIATWILENNDNFVDMYAGIIDVNTNQPMEGFETFKINTNYGDTVEKSKVTIDSDIAIITWLNCQYNRGHIVEARCINLINGHPITPAAITIADESPFNPTVTAYNKIALITYTTELTSDSARGSFIKGRYMDMTNGQPIGGPRYIFKHPKQQGINPFTTSAGNKCLVLWENYDYKKISISSIRGCFLEIQPGGLATLPEPFTLSSHNQVLQENIAADFDGENAMIAWNFHRQDIFGRALKFIQ